MESPKRQVRQRAKHGLASLLQECFCCGLLLVDEAGKLRLVSPEAAHALGLERDLQDADYHELPTSIAEVIGRVRAADNITPNLHAQIQHGPDLAWLSVSIAPFSTARPPALAVIVKYVATAGKLDPDLRHLDRLATLGALSAATAHELKNAFVAVRTFIDLLLEKNRDDDLVAIVRSEMKRIGSILNRTLKLAGSPQADFCPLQINEVLEHSLRLVMPECEKHMVEVVQHLAPGLPPLSGSEHALEQALLNLFLNAVDAMVHGGTLKVGSGLAAVQISEGEAAQRIEITVEDSGAGINPDHLARLFDPFFTTKPHGTGLGLSITRRIVEEHGGSISVESHPGSGTCFRVLLPVYQPSPEPHTAPSIAVKTEPAPR
jgi:signal transduction histidine kinase